LTAYNVITGKKDRKTIYFSGTYIIRHAEVKAIHRASIEDNKQINKLRMNIQQVIT
jgi:hypothetical protein